MHLQLFRWEWACAYCRLPPLDGDLVCFISESEVRCTGSCIVIANRNTCPRQQCRRCQTARLAYPFHLDCLGTLQQFLNGQNLLEDDDWHLRCAQAMALIPVLPNKQALTPRSLTNALYISFQRIMDIVSDQTPLASLLQRLRYDLPPELQEHVFSFMLDSPGGYSLFFEKTLDVIEKLCSWPEKRQRSISCDGTLFARWGDTGKLSNLMGLYEDSVQGSVQIKVDKNWNYIFIQWIDSRITHIAFVGSDSDLALATASGSGYIQILRRPMNGTLWVTMEGLFTSRLDFFKKHHRRILWKTPAPLPWKDLSEQHQIHMARYGDVVLAYHGLEGVRGISVAHCNSKIEFIQFHKEQYNDSIYGQVHEEVTWMYCPVDDGEAIVGIWLVRHSSTGTGLFVKTANKVAWLCPYSDASVAKDFRLLASAETRAICHCACMQDFCSIPAHPSISQRFEHCEFPNLPSILKWRHPYQWSSSAASLNNVHAVRRSKNGRGIELRYGNFSNCLGDFRPSEALDWIQEPVYFKVSRANETRHTISFFREKDENMGAEVLPLSNRCLVFWSCKDNVIIEVTQVQ